MNRPRVIRTALIGAAALLGGAGPALAAPGDVTLVSLSSAGILGASPVEASAVSADGRVVAFTSAAALTATPTGGTVQLYVRDRIAGTTTLASASATGAAANAAVDSSDVGNIQFAVSGDGRYVVFASTAANLTPADTDAAQDVFRKDLVTGAVTLVSVSSSGAKANAAVFGDPDVSADGNRVSFGSGQATNLFPADGNNASDVVVRDIAAGTTTLAAQTTAGVPANGTTERSAISADGRAVAFEAPTGTFNLDPADADNRGNDVFARSLANGVLSAVSDPTKATGSGFPDISGDGRYVVFETGEKYDATNDLSAGNDVYRRDLGTGAIVLVSARDGLDASGGTNGLRPQISADGARVAFTSASTDLVLPVVDGNGAADVFTRDVAARTTRLVSAAGATQGATDSDRPQIAANGGLVAFIFTDGATRLVTGDTNTQPDAHATELTPSDATGPALTLSGPADGTVEAADRIAVGGTATDVSGIVSVTVNGTPVALTATGGFSTAVAAAVGANAITVRALDGAGNAATIVRTVTRSAPVVVPPRVRARLLALGARLTKAGKVSVTIRLSADARVRVSLLRRTVLKGRRPRVVLRAVGTPVTKALKAGRRTVTLAPGRRKLTVGRYVVRVRILTPVVGPAVRTVAFRISAR